MAARSDSAIALCEECKGETNADCSVHGIGSSLERINDRWQRVGGGTERSGGTD